MGTHEKKEWCCANKDIGCPYSCLSRELWTDEKRDWCCTNKNLGCLATPVVSRAASQQHNCYSRDVRGFWTHEKKEWCCANKDIGCPYSCLSRELWTDEKRDWCCTNKNLGCLATPVVSRAASQQYNCYSRDVRDFWTDEKKNMVLRKQRDRLSARQRATGTYFWTALAFLCTGAGILA